jgi:hypothetical protein
MFGLSLVGVAGGLAAVGALWWLGLARLPLRASFAGALVELRRSIETLALLDAGLALVLCGIVGLRSDLGSSWPGMLVLVWLASLAGSALGLALVSALPSLNLVVPCVVVVLVLMVLGGPIRPLASLNGAGRALAAAVPTRWAFEGLMLLATGEDADNPDGDPVEPFFRAEVDRAGALACGLALAAMAGGWAYAAAVMASMRSRST